MSEDIKAKLYRAGAQVYPNSFLCQLDKMSPQEAGGYQGAEPHFTYEVFTTQLPIKDPQLVRQGDLLIDQVVIDSVTNTNRQFRIVSDPEPFLDGHWEMVAYRYRGT
jgi:hypothetical protein